MSDWENYRDDVLRLCVRIRSATPDRSKSILLTGVSERDPVAQIASETARTMVSMGEGPVLLVDANFSRQDGSRKKSQRHAEVLPETRPGLLEVLSQKCALADAVESSELPGLFVLGKGDVDGDYASVVHSDQCAEVFKEICHNYNYVIIESAAIATHAECLRIAAHVDGVAAVVQAGLHQQSELVGLKRVVDGFHLPFLGVILCSSSSH